MISFPSEKEIRRAGAVGTVHASDLFRLSSVTNTTRMKRRESRTPFCEGPGVKLHSTPLPGVYDRPEPLLYCQLLGGPKALLCGKLPSCVLASRNPSNLGITKTAMSTAPKQAPTLKPHSPVATSNNIIVERPPSCVWRSRSRFPRSLDTLR
jgi:hypothetical protein